MISSALRSSRAQWDAIGIATHHQTMDTRHVAAPKTPGVEIIEAMVEAALDNKHNMEAIYRAIIATLEKTRTEKFKMAKDDLIVEISIAAAVQSINKSPPGPVVLIDVQYGTKGQVAHGFLPIASARQLAWDLAHRALEAEEMPRRL